MPARKQPSLDEVASAYFEIHKNFDIDRISEHCERAGIFAPDAKDKVYTRVKELLEAWKKTSQTNESHAFEKSEKILEQISLQTSAINDGIPTLVKELFYTTHQIYVNRYLHKKTTDGEWYVITTNDRILNGYLEFVAIVRYMTEEDDKKRIKLWHVKFKDVDFIGNFEELVNFVFNLGTVIAKKDSLKSIVGAINIVLEPDLPTHFVYPAVGIYYDPVEKKSIAALGDEKVKPLTDMQSTFFEKVKRNFLTAEMDKSKEAFQASVDFIESMPQRNVYSALIARGYSTLAPIAYILKSTPLSVFPYLYLYGEKGSSKTHIAEVSATYTYGDTEVLTSDSVKSEFRLGMEFSATTFPRVIDEAHDVFAKNISIFKSGATSTMATKRGSKDKTMDKYSALCAFVFTSNIIPISSEEDVQGALMDRVLVCNCEKGADFDKEKYNRAMMGLQKYSAVIGRKNVEILVEKLNEKGLQGVVDEIRALADTIMTLDPSVNLRRAYCLAELAYGIKLYLDLVAREGLQMVISPLLYEDKGLCEMLLVKLQSDVKIEEMENLRKFMSFVITMDEARDEERHRNGIFRAIHYGEAVFGGGTARPVLITSNALDQYKKFYGLKAKPFNSLKELAQNLRTIGIVDAKDTNNKRVGNIGERSVKINILEYSERMQIYMEQDN